VDNDIKKQSGYVSGIYMWDLISIAAIMWFAIFIALVIRDLKRKEVVENILGKAITSAILAPFIAIALIIISKIILIGLTILVAVVLALIALRILRYFIRIHLNL